MRRRRVLAASGLVGLGGVSGCLDRLDTSGGELETDDESDDTGGDGKRESGFERREYPEPPNDLDPDAVRSHVTAYEEAYQYNTTPRADSVSFSTSCDTVIDREVDEGVVASTYCGHNFSSEDASGMGFSDPTLYLVTTEETNRVAPVERTHDDPYEGEETFSEETSRTPGWHGIWITNFDAREHDLYVRATHRSGDDPVTVFEQTFDIRSEFARHITQITAAEGTYELHAELADGASTTETFDLPNTSVPIVRGWLLGAVVVTPGGGLDVRDLRLP
ncbi:hypothetical protein OB905_05065 [Halobacteria archaeon AArc-dxtr1]|nr:hypothetical protein [Halobacteria archaeon AArc-dxtr1]